MTTAMLLVLAIGLLTGLVAGWVIGRWDRAERQFGDRLRRADKANRVRENQDAYLTRKDT